LARSWARLGVSVHELKGTLVYYSRFVDEGRDPLPIRWPPAANLPGPEVRSPVTPFSASEGQQFGANDPEETRRAFRYSFQPFQRPTLSEVGQVRAGPARARPGGAVPAGAGGAGPSRAGGGRLGLAKARELARQLSPHAQGPVRPAARHAGRDRSE